MQNKNAELLAQESEIIQLSCFYIGDVLCGININTVQEINKNLQMTRVPLSPDYVLGIMNLRGQIVTIIDLGKKIDLNPAQITDSSRTIIVNWNEESVGFLVDSITDVHALKSKEIMAPPSNIKGVKGKFFQGVYKTEHELIGILDINTVLSELAE